MPNASVQLKKGNILKNFNHHRIQQMPPFSNSREERTNFNHHYTIIDSLVQVEISPAQFFQYHWRGNRLRI